MWREKVCLSRPCISVIALRLFPLFIQTTYRSGLSHFPREKKRDNIQVSSDSIPSSKKQVLKSYTEILLCHTFQRPSGSASSEK